MKGVNKSESRLVCILSLFAFNVLWREREREKLSVRLTLVSHSFLLPAFCSPLFSVVLPAGSVFVSEQESSHRMAFTLHCVVVVRSHCVCSKLVGGERKFDYRKRHTHTHNLKSICLSNKSDISCFFCSTHVQ